MRIPRLLLALSLALALPLGTAAQESPDTLTDNHCDNHCPFSLAPMPDSLGRSGHFAGMLGDDLIMAGGCNFPGVPAARGGTKRFYADVWRLKEAVRVDTLADCWTPTGIALPQPVAYGATVQTDSAIYLVGGASASGTLSGFGRLRDSCGSLVYEALPPLPVGIDNGGAAMIDSIIYVTGGRQADGHCGLYAFDLRRSAWRRLADYPGLRREQPVVAAAAGRLWLMGGYNNDAATKHCTLATDVLGYDPQTGRWQACGTLPTDSAGQHRCLVGASGVGLPDRVVITGGVDASIFRAAVEGRAPADYLRRPTEWYRFNSGLFIFDAITGQWARVACRIPALARAGGALVLAPDFLIMVGGETKPGVRSPLVTAFPLE